MTSGAKAMQQNKTANIEFQFPTLEERYIFHVAKRKEDADLELKRLEKSSMIASEICRQAIEFMGKYQCNSEAEAVGDKITITRKNGHHHIFEVIEADRFAYQSKFLKRNDVLDLILELIEAKMA